MAAFTPQVFALAAVLASPVQVNAEDAARAGSAREDVAGMVMVLASVFGASVAVPSALERYPAVRAHLRAWASEVRQSLTPGTSGKQSGAGLLLGTKQTARSRTRMLRGMGREVARQISSQRSAGRGRRQRVGR